MATGPQSEAQLPYSTVGAWAENISHAPRNRRRVGRFSASVLDDLDSSRRYEWCYQKSILSTFVQIRDSTKSV